MRRLIGLFLAVVSLMVLPLAPATAQQERVEVVVASEEVPVAVAPDGATITSGTWAILFEGEVVGGGTVHGRYYDPGGGVHGTRHFVDAVDGSTTDTQVKGYIVDIDPTGTVLTYVYQETIVADSNGFGGRGRGEALLTVAGDGFVLEAATHVILSLP